MKRADKWINNTLLFGGPSSDEAGRNSIISHPEQFVNRKIKQKSHP